MPLEVADQKDGHSSPEQPFRLLACSPVVLDPGGWSAIQEALVRRLVLWRYFLAPPQKCAVAALPGSGPPHAGALPRDGAAPFEEQSIPGEIRSIWLAKAEVV